MNPAVHMSVSANTALAAMAPYGRGPEKTSTDKDFSGDGGNWAKRQAAFRTGAASRASRQNGTEQLVPERHRDGEEPRLSSSFVAQLLGQVLVHPDAVPSRSGAAYDRGIGTLSQFDRQL